MQKRTTATSETAQAFVLHSIVKTLKPWWNYTPRGAARELLQSRATEIIISGPAGTGKTRACLEKIVWFARRYPKSRHLIVRKTRASLSETALVTLERDVLGESHPLVLNGPSRPHRVSYTFANGSQIVVSGLDKPERLLSADYDMIYVQQAEEIEESDWEFLITRLRSNKTPYQQIIGDCNPDRPGHWILHRKTLVLLNSRHEDNPLLYDATSQDWTEYGRQYLAKLELLTGARYQRLRYGRWVQAEGVVFPEWNPSVHICDPFTIPEDWLRFRSIDFGFVNPFVCLWLAVDHDGRIYVYRQWYMSQRIVSEHARIIRELSQNEQIAYTVADHDAEDRATLERCGIPTVPADKRILPGIQAISDFLRVDATGKPRLLVFRDSLVEVDRNCANDNRPYRLEHEFDAYVWSSHNNREMPLKLYDHAMDALRYAVMSRANMPEILFL
jgi:phage terminase large subunit